MLQITQLDLPLFSTFGKLIFRLCSDLEHLIIFNLPLTDPGIRAKQWHFYAPSA